VLRRVGVAVCPCGDVGDDFWAWKIEGYLEWGAGHVGTEGSGGCGMLVEEGPGIRAAWGNGTEGVADLFAGETTWKREYIEMRNTEGWFTILVAEHEHVQSSGGRVIEEVDSWIRLAVRRRRKESCRCSERDDSIMRSKRKSKNRRRVIASEWRNHAGGIETISLHEVRAHRAKAASSILWHMSKLALEIGRV